MRTTCLAVVLAVAVSAGWGCVSKKAVAPVAPVVGVSKVEGQKVRPTAPVRLGEGNIKVRGAPQK